jgi:hypothetical protein
VYFMTSAGRGVYHVLDDEQTGTAPCGARLSRFDTFCLNNERPTPTVVTEKPEEAPLCKQCERMEEAVW